MGITSAVELRCAISCQVGKYSMHAIHLCVSFYVREEGSCTLEHMCVNKAERGSRWNSLLNKLEKVTVWHRRFPVLQTNSFLLAHLLHLNPNTPHASSF